MTYRPQIDGLRAIAVIAVVVFHLDKEWLPGGFLGVDVFFTISGYLICSIILREISQNEFSIWKFWRRRVRRLLPALMLMVACVLIAGGLLMTRPERSELPMQAAASLFSFANFYFWRTTGGYWAAPTHSLPLLHTWTLSLEEQFYLVLPPLLILLCRFGKNLQLATISALLAASFLLCVGATPFFRSASFFLLPTRMWELLLGVLLAWWHYARPIQNQQSKSFGLLPDFGIGLIFISFWLIPNNEAFPGWKPLVPCLGVLLLLNARAPGFSPALCILKFPPIVFVGKLSYSIYLWHWPVFVFLPYTGTTSTLAKLFCTAVLAILSYFLVEKPIRYGSRRAALGWAFVVGLTIIGFAFLKLNPISPLLADWGNLDDPRSLTRGREFEALAMLREHLKGSDSENDLKRPLICLAGSSHVRVLGKPVECFAEESGYGFVSLATSNLGLTSKPHPEVPDAEAVNSKRMDLIRELAPEVVIVAGMWSNESNREDFSAELSSVLKNIGDAGKQVIVLGQVPMVRIPDGYENDLRRYLIAGRLSGGDTRAIPDLAVAIANETVREVVEDLERSDIAYIDPTSTLIASGQVRLIEGRYFLYSDYHHVNDDGAKVVFDEVMRQALLDAIRKTKLSN
jgi:peptidoglycan/LPS O-acetylase OafA/YrhL